MTLKEQLYICTLARCQTITKASEELYISQPALSAYVSKVETYLGVKLFERTGKRLLLTPIGEEYVIRAGQMLKLKEEFDNLLEQQANKKKRTIRIGIAQRRAITMIPYVMAGMAKTYPDTEIIVREGLHDRLVLMYQNNEVDLLMCVHRDELPDAEYVDLGLERIVLAVHLTHPAVAAMRERYGKDISWMDMKLLDKETFILPVKGHSLRANAERIMEQFLIRPGRVIEMVNFETATSLVNENLGVAFNRQGYLSAMGHLDNVCYYSIGESTHYSRLVVAYKKGRKLIPQMEYAIELMRECVEKYGEYRQNV